VVDLRGAEAGAHGVDDFVYGPPAVDERYDQLEEASFHLRIAGLRREHDPIVGKDVRVNVGGKLGYLDHDGSRCVAIASSVSVSKSLAARCGHASRAGELGLT
jgi:hypothetical protein